MWPVRAASPRRSVVIKNPDRKKNTVTPKPPGIHFKTPVCDPKTMRKLTARKPSSEGM
jgi:hypothetical protein